MDNYKNEDGQLLDLLVDKIFSNKDMPNGLESVILGYGVSENSGNTLSQDDLGFASKVLLKKLSYFKIPVEFKSNYGVKLLELLSYGSAGIIQVLTLEVLKAVDKSKWGCLSYIDILNVVSDDLHSYSVLEGLWDAQKTCEGFNNVDTVDYWREQLGLS